LNVCAHLPDEGQNWCWKGKSKAEIVAAIASALDEKGLPALEPGAMCYMMSKQQVLRRPGHPHLIFFVSGMRRKPGTDLPGSLIMAADTEKWTTILMVWVGN
jgi:hypothetical protein